MGEAHCPSFMKQLMTDEDGDTLPDLCKFSKNEFNDIFAAQGDLTELFDSLEETAQPAAQVTLLSRSSNSKGLKHWAQENHRFSKYMFLKLQASASSSPVSVSGTFAAFRDTAKVMSVPSLIVSMTLVVIWRQYRTSGHASNQEVEMA